MGRTGNVDSNCSHTVSAAHEKCWDSLRCLPEHISYNSYFWINRRETGKWGTRKFLLLPGLLARRGDFAGRPFLSTRVFFVLLSLQAYAEMVLKFRDALAFSLS
jgi:hypothetical protein